MSRHLPDPGNEPRRAESSSLDEDMFERIDPSLPSGMIPGLFTLPNSPVAESPRKSRAEVAWRWCLHYSPEFEALLREFVRWMAIDEESAKARKLDLLIFHVWLMRSTSSKRNDYDVHLCHLFMLNFSEAGMSAEELKAIAEKAESSMREYNRAFDDFNEDDMMPLAGVILRKVAAGGEALEGNRRVTRQMAHCVKYYYLWFKQALIDGTQVDLQAVRDDTVRDGGADEYLDPRGHS
jgi:hypothetical protein